MPDVTGNEIGDPPDELRAGSETTPVRLPRWLPVLAAVVVLSAAGFVVRGALGSPEAAPSPTPTPSAAPARQPWTTPDESGLAGPLAVGAVCTHTDGSDALTVQFQIQNIGAGRVRVLAVRPVLPIGGLRPGPVTLPRSPSCGTPAARTGPSTVLEPGGRVGAQLAFVLPAECPAPYPVEADVDLLAVGEAPGTQRLHLLADLGGIHFAACPGS
jgi:hypothetical protein